MESQNIQIEPLTNENYHTWKVKAKAMLLVTDKWKYVNGECKRPTRILLDVENAKEILAWDDADQIALSSLILSISESVIWHIKCCKTSHEAWNKLQSIYQSKSPARKLSLVRLLLQKMADQDDVCEQLAKFFETVDRLAEINMEIDDDFQVAILLNKLPTSFESFYSAIGLKNELPKPEELKIEVMKEYDLQRARNVSKQLKQAFPTIKPSNSISTNFSFK